MPTSVAGSTLNRCRSRWRLARPCWRCLREDLQLTGTKHGCELGECGACAVLVDGEPILSCLYLALDAEDCAIDTIEGMAGDAQLHPLQAAFADLGGAQCGYCTPAILLTARALLDKQPNPGRQQIREALSGNLCRCTGYQQIYESVEEAILRINQSADNQQVISVRNRGQIEICPRWH